MLSKDRRNAGHVAVSIQVLLSLLVLAGCQMLRPAGTVPQPDYWPTDGWRTSTPEAQGIDSNRLAELLLTARDRNVQIHSLLLIRHGYAVVDAAFYPYDGETLHNVASVTKSLMTTLIGIAADRGELNLDDKMVSFFPDRTIASLNDSKKAISIRHLASMSSGLSCTAAKDERTLTEMLASPDYVQFVLDRPVVWEPGRHFIYCSPAIHLLSPILQQATGLPALDFARQYLFKPLGIGEVLWPQDPQGYYNGWADVSMNPRDMAKLGFLYLHRGEWDSRQVLSSEWVDEATKAQIATDDDPYGYGWWIETDKEGARADGRGGQLIYVFPKWDMIIVTTGGGFTMDEIAEQLAASFSDFDEPLPANPEGVARLESAVAGVARPQQPAPVAPLPEVARRISGKTFVLEPNPTTLETVAFDFDGSSEANFAFTATGSPLHSVPVGLDGLYRFTPGPDGRPTAFRGSWIDAQSFSLEYDGITNNDHSLFQFHFDGELVEVSARETAHEVGAQFAGRLQRP